MSVFENQKFKKLRDSAMFRRFCRLLCEMSGLRLIFMDSETEKRDSLDYKDGSGLLCNFMRKNPGFLAACKKCDAIHFAEAVKKKHAVCYACHAGLMDVIVPIRINGIQSGALIGGQLFLAPPSEKSFHEFFSGVRSYGFDSEMLRDFFFKTKRMDAKRLKCVVELAELFAEHVEELGSRIFDERKGEGLAETALEILRKEYRTPMTLSDLAEKLGITPQYASSLLTKETGDTFGGHIANLRVERVKLLLESSDYSLEWIASEAGFSSIRSFNRCFKAFTGMTPSEWRRSLSR